jgi:RNase H-like domain found in reverse transcriptase
LKFVKNYGLTSYCWSEEATGVFETLKKAMCEAPVLAMPNFAESFILETDACDKGVRVVLMQGKRLIAYLSKALGVKTNNSLPMKKNS